MTNNNKNRIAFQGEFGANSDMACREIYPNMESVPCATFEDAFDALKNGDVELAMIPIENTLAGRVADIHQLLPHSGLHIVGEHFLSVHLHLMALSGVKIGEIKKVYSHIHALGQCRNLLQKNGWRGEVAGDTAGSAKLISENKDRAAAALAPKLAAQLYGLDILQENVEDSKTNTTRFIILSKESKIPPLNKKNEKNNDEKNMITTFIFRVRNVPAALYKVLGGFATNGVNMTKLESYQENNFSATMFYADIEGHIEESRVKLAFEEMDFFCVEHKVLGVYSAAKNRI